MKKISKILWGAVLITLGTLFALNALNIVDFSISDVFFKGWWTLIIIIPCFIGLFTESDKTGNLIGIAIGVVLLLCVRDVLPYRIFGKLILPVIIIAIGLKLIFGGIAGNRAAKIISDASKEGKRPENGFAAFSESVLNFDGVPFENAELNAVFGGVKCDLSRAIINKDCAINATAVFGGIKIIVPPNVTVKVSSNSIFGGVSNKASSSSGEYTIYITGNCMFGGIDIK